MNKELTIRIIVHPFFIGLIASALIIGVTMPEIERYKVTLEGTIHYGSNTNLFFDDLDGDGHSEEINVDRSESMMKVMLFKGTRLMEQYNLHTDPVPGKYYFTGDYNRDGYNELFFFTRSNDSLLLTIIDPVIKKDFILKDRLIFFSDTIHFDLDMPEITMTRLMQYSDDMNKDFIFTITTGYSKRPRNTYRYDISSDILHVSPKSGATLYAGSIIDLNSDSIPEIIVNTAATGNYNVEYPYRDNSSWLMVFDHQMKFYFPPVQFSGYPSVLLSLPFYHEDSVFIITLHDYYGTENLKSGLYLFNSAGTLIRSKTIAIHDRNSYYLMSGDPARNQEIHLIDDQEHKIIKIGFDMSEISSQKIPDLNNAWPLNELDLDLDGKRELIFLGEEFGTVTILGLNGRHAVTVDVGEDQYPERVLQLNRNGRKLFYLHYRNNGYFFEYKSNPIYYAKYPFAVAVYAVISFFILLIYKAQRFRAEKQYQTQRRISELQILSLKNQIDPHFTFNILNSIGSLYSRGENPQQAYDIFVKYSKLLRQTIQNSDKISISLEDELDFVKNYIELEQFRGDHSFNFEMIYHDGIDSKRSIPRMLIHSFVENSIKHGIRRLHSGGVLVLEVSHQKNAHYITVRDNGPGLGRTVHREVAGTGKGLKIVNDLIRLFNELESSRISYTFGNMLDKTGQITGTSVVVEIPD